MPRCAGNSPSDPVAILSAWRLRQACRVIASGGVVAYPTEAVYGLGCDPWREEAVERLLALKRRPMAKGLILVAAGFDQLAPFLAPLPPERLRAVLATWPGPVTWVMPAARSAPRWLRGGHETLAVRVSDHPVVAALCRACGPLVSTSANRSGGRPARSAAEVRRMFGSGIFVLNGPLGGLPRPTEIRDASTGRLLRPG